jgi:hypothetical protein
MPVILAPDISPAWLGEEPADEARLKSLLARISQTGSVHRDPESEKIEL